MTEKRFVETVSTGIVTDTITGKEYRCEMRIDEDLLELLNDLDDENTKLKAQLYCDSDEGVCIICKHHYLEKGKTYEKYYISKCKKGHEKCSKMDLKYCEDFKELRE